MPRVRGNWRRAVEFPSEVNAVACAVEIQRAMPSRNADVPDGGEFHLRMGINYELEFDRRPDPAMAGDKS